MQKNTLKSYNLTPKIALTQFIQYLELDRGVRSHTLNSYTLDLKQFFTSIEDRKLSTLTEKDIEKYIHLLYEMKQKAKTIARKISSLRQFFLFLCREEYLEHNPTESILAPKTMNTLPSCLTLEETQKLLLTIQTGQIYQTKLKEVFKLRDYTMMTLLYATGLRVSELVSLRLDKCDLRNCLLKVEGKGGKERLVPFFEKVAQLISNYVDSARPLLQAKTTHLFLNKNGCALTRQAFFLLLQKHAHASGIEKKISPHTLRHTYATHLLKSGLDLRSLQTLLGHSDLSTTQIYTHINPEHLKESHKKYHPRGGG